MSDKKELGMMPEIEPSTTTGVGDIKNVDEKGRPVIVEDAEEFLRMHQHEWGDYTEQDAKRVLRRIDWRLMPLLMVTLTFAGVDVSILIQPCYVKDTLYLT